MDFTPLAILFTAIAALLGIGLSTYSIWWQKKTAIVNARPLLAIDQKIKRDTSREVKLYNKGLGTAVIRDGTFSKGDRNGKRSIADVLDIDTNLQWNYYEFGDEVSYLRAGESIMLWSLSVDMLAQYRNLSHEAAYNTFHTVDKQVTGIRIFVRYDDLFANKQRPLDTTIDSSE